MINYLIIPVGELLGKEYEEQKLVDAFKEFSCRQEGDLENFLTCKAITYEKANFGKTYLFIDEKMLNMGKFRILAYFTIAQRVIDISAMSNKKRRTVLGLYPGRESINAVPTYLIGQLGRADYCSNSDLPGELILQECYHVISMAAKIVGGNMVILECREHMYEKVYKDLKFKKLYDETDNGLYTLYKKIDFTEYWKC